MHVVTARNVCEALPLTLRHLIRNGQKDDSRVGPVLVSPTPIMTETLRPYERVLFSAVRDANPFFHMFEAIWMLAGRNDAAPLNDFVKNFGALYGEIDGKVHGAYGYRWRKSFGLDQIAHVIGKLIANKTDRQAVLQMWDCSSGNDDLAGTWRDRPCNTHCYLRVRLQKGAPVLDLTVCCRSNDMIWGAHGSNAVHFSVLLEYLAARIDVGIGTMYQLSNNAHAYQTELDRLTDRMYEHSVRTSITDALFDDRYKVGMVKATPMFDEPAVADEDITLFCQHYDAGAMHMMSGYQNFWFMNVLAPAMHSHQMHKAGDHDKAIWLASQIQSTDWQIACVEWLKRRTIYEQRKDHEVTGDGREGNSLSRVANTPHGNRRGA